MTETFTRGCHHSGWTQDREDLLKKLYLEGHSASIIAARISVTGFSVTRNAVIGKAHRLCLNGQQPRTSRGARIRKRKPKEQRPVIHGAQRKSAKLFLTAEPFVPSPELVIPVHERRGIAGLTEEQCRWPIGDPQMADFHFCNGVKVPGLSYCDVHCRRAYTPPKPLNRSTVDHTLHADARGFKPHLQSVGGRLPDYDKTKGLRDFDMGDAPINTREKADA
jgi:GcrA cell cycle regulator